MATSHRFIPANRVDHMGTDFKVHGPITINPDYIQSLRPHPDHTDYTIVMMGNHEPLIIDIPYDTIRSWLS